jgi:hypothetical protein
MLDTGLLKEAFTRAFETSIKHNPPSDIAPGTVHKLRSSTLVSELANAIESTLSPVWVKHVQDVENGLRNSGEWLFDICFTHQPEIQEQGTKFLINTKVDWVVESEFHVGINKFAEDFGKLLVVQSDHVVFLSGLSQTTDEGIQSFIKRRLNTVSEVLMGQQERNFQRLYFGFWPAPSRWDEQQLLELVGRIQLFSYNPNSNKFTLVE